MSNYSQNKNNMWENLAGECVHLNFANKILKIMPINIILNKTPYKNIKGIITKIENIEFGESSIRCY